jgi:hypothetical protein
VKEPHEVLSVSRTVAAMLVALLGTMAAHLVLSAARGELSSIRSSPVATLLVGVYAGLAGLVLVLPFLILLPRLRLVAHWIAALWGAGVAVGFSLLLVGPRFLSVPTGAALAALGAASGATYSLAARALMRRQPPA